MKDPRHALEQRIGSRPAGWFSLRTDLRHLAFINFAVPTSTLEELIPEYRFAILEFSVRGAPRALVSAVFLSYAMVRLPGPSPDFRCKIFQTNYRVYVCDRKLNDYAVWFLGGSVESRLTGVGRLLWGLPWDYADYETNCAYSRTAKRYEAFSIKVASEAFPAEAVLEDTGAPLTVHEGFESLDEMKLILTHPAKGYYRRPDGNIGVLSVRHDELVCTEGKSVFTNFGFLKRLGILSRDKRQEPHSVMICPSATFEIAIPPGKIRADSA